MPIAEPAINPPEPRVEAKIRKSKGGKLFDWGVYGGIAGVGTFIVTIPMAFVLKDGKRAGQYERVVGWVEKHAGRFLSPSTAKKFAEEAVMTTTLMQGGNAMLIPVGIAEHYKVPIVTALDEKLGDQASPESIEATPKQTWMSLIEGRMLAWGAVFSTLFSASLAFPKTFQTFTNEFAERACKLVGKPTWDVAKNQESRAFKLGKLGALDVFATAAAATLLYVGGHFFARRHEEKKAHLPPSHHPLFSDTADAVGEGLPAVRDAGPDSTILGAKTHAGPITNVPQPQLMVI